MNIEVLLKKLEENYTEIKDVGFDPRTNHVTPRGFGHAIELIKAYQECDAE